MNGQQIIDRFNTITDDQADLSESQLLDLLNKVYRMYLDDRDWLFLHKTATGTLTTSSLEVDLPSDFRNLVDNYRDQDQTKPVLYVDTTYEVYNLINQDQKRQYNDTRGYFYVDYRQNKIILTGYEDTSRVYEFDYTYDPDDLTTSSTPVIPTKFHRYLANGMAYLWNDIDGTDKSFSYRAENKVEFESGLNQMQYEDFKRRK